VPLTKRGVEEAIEAGKRISYIPVDMIFTSALIRAQMTAMLAMTQHHQEKVVMPLIIQFASYLIEKSFLHVLVALVIWCFYLYFVHFSSI